MKNLEMATSFARGRSFFAHLKRFAAAIGFATLCAASNATIVSVVTSNVGGVNHYSADIAVINNGSLPEITGFTLYFDENEFSNLALAASPSTWDTLLIPPDLGIPAAGFLDAFVLDTANRLLTGDSIGGFTVTFDFLGQGAPGAMAFDIVDFDFNVLFSGESDTRAFVPGTGGQVPEPGTLWLLMFGAAGVIVHSKKALLPSPKHMLTARVST